MANPINIFTLNIRGLNNDKKRRTILRWLKNNNAKIAFLQETFTQNDLDLGNEWTAKFNNTDSAHSRGVAVVFSNSLNFKILNIHKTDDARVILINAEIEKNEVTLCNVYAPNDRRHRSNFFKKLKNWIPRYADFPDNLIVSGDFNCAINNNDRTGNNDDYTRNDMKNLLHSLKVIDAWSITNKYLQYTFITENRDKTVSKSRIDYIYISETFRHNIKQVKLKHIPQKDKHRAIQMNIILKCNDKGPGYWKLNANLLEIKEYENLIDFILNDCLSNFDMLDWRSKWAMFKIRTQEGSIKFGIVRAKKKKEYINNLQKKVDELNKNEDRGVDINKGERDKIKKDIDMYYQEKDNGYIIRSKYKWKTEGERSTKYFFNLEKTRQKKNVIKQLRDKNGNLCHEDDEILEICTDFYDILFTSKDIPQDLIDEYLGKIKNEKKLSEAEKLSCDSKIKESEIADVIKNLKTEKSPGSDGLTPEFYKKFWPKIKFLFMKMVEETYEKGELDYSMRKALLALLFKKGDETLLKNFRPISLTNYDYKIICFALANRLQKVLKNIIHEDQTGYIKGRYIGTNARIIEDYFEHCQDFNIPGILLFLDFEKAFDSVEWNFMISVLDKFNFGEGFKKWVKILYNKPIISIKNNGWLSKDIKLHRGVRQGCPLSALLFVLTVEIMAIKIRQNKNIHGFQCADQEIKTSMYADDTSLLLSDLDSLKYAIDTVNDFSAVAGPKLNVDKTEGVLLGPLKNSINEFYGIKFTNNAIRCLGIYLGHDKEQCYKKNWVDKTEKIKKILEKWKNRHLSIIGKVLIIKSLAASILQHPMSILHTPENILKDVEKLIFGFLWNSNDRIKRKTLIGQKELGGINMLDIFCKNKATKASWMKRISNQNVNSIFINMRLEKFGLDCNYLAKTTLKDPKMLSTMLKIPIFWAEVVCYANECKSQIDNNSLNSDDFLSEPIWLNDRFRLNNKPILISNWTKSSILYVKDIFSNGSLINEQILLDKLQNKSNWISEYTKVNKIFKTLSRKFNTTNAEYINIKNTWNILSNNKIHCMKNMKSKLYYQILIDKKFTSNYMQNVWEREFNIENIRWDTVYKNLWEINDRKLCEFKYKILTNILSNRSLVSRWNKNITNKCVYCNEIQNVKHMLYECPRVKNAWILIGSILQLEIRYKHIVLGNLEKSEFIKARNLLISYISYSIYKHWIQSENNTINFISEPLLDYIKRDLFSRTLYNTDNDFIMLCDKLVSNL